LLWLVAVVDLIIEVIVLVVALEIALHQVKVQVRNSRNKAISDDHFTALFSFNENTSRQ
jgi:hypothetical protein